MTLISFDQIREVSLCLWASVSCHPFQRNLIKANSGFIMSEHSRQNRVLPARRLCDGVDGPVSVMDSSWLWAGLVLGGHRWGKRKSDGCIPSFEHKGWVSCTHPSAEQKGGQTTHQAGGSICEGSVTPPAGKERKAGSSGRGAWEGLEAKLIFNQLKLSLYTPFVLQKYKKYHIA